MRRDDDNSTSNVELYDSTVRARSTKYNLRACFSPTGSTKKIPAYAHDNGATVLDDVTGCRGMINKFT